MALGERPNKDDCQGHQALNLQQSEEDDLYDLKFPTIERNRYGHRGNGR